VFGSTQLSTSTQLYSKADNSLDVLLDRVVNFAPEFPDGQHEEEYKTRRGNYDPRDFSSFAFYWGFGPENHFSIRII
jgi:hypothetical protein